MITMHEALKSLHILAVVVWIGSMLSAALLISRLHDGKAMSGARRALSPLMTVAMIMALALGLLIAMQTGWISQRWVQAKLALAVVLAGLHGVLSGQMRRLSAADETFTIPLFRFLPAALGILALAAIVLAVSKP